MPGRLFRRGPRIGSRPKAVRATEGVLPRLIPLRRCRLPSDSGWRRKGGRRERSGDFPPRALPAKRARWTAWRRRRRDRRELRPHHGEQSDQVGYHQTSFPTGIQGRRSKVSVQPSPGCKVKHLFLLDLAGDFRV
jgi:hypothetical protein